MLFRRSSLSPVFPCVCHILQATLKSRDLYPLSYISDVRQTSHLRIVVIRQDNDLRICIAKRSFMQMLHKQIFHAMCSLSYISDVRPNIFLLSYHSIPRSSIIFRVQCYKSHLHACGFPHQVPVRYRLLSFHPACPQTVPAFLPEK